MTDEFIAKAERFLIVVEVGIAVYILTLIFRAIMMLDTIGFVLVAGMVLGYGYIELRDIWRTKHGR